MGPTVVYYTNGILPKPLLRRTLAEASRAAKGVGGCLVVSSHVPLFTGAAIDCSSSFLDLACVPDRRFLDYLATVGPFHEPGDCEVNLVTGHLRYSPVSIARQIVHAVNHCLSRHPAILLFEHDVLYPERYAGEMVQALTAAEFAVYYDHAFLDRDGYFKPECHFWHLSRYAARSRSIRPHFERKIRSLVFQTLEPILSMHRTTEEAPGDEVITNYEVCSGPPVLDIRHGTNASGQILVDQHYATFDHWGDLSENGLLKLLDDPDYERLAAGWPELGYGLFRS